LLTVGPGKSLTEIYPGAAKLKNHGPWKIKSSREIYRDPFITVSGDDVIRPDGADGHHVVVQLKAGVCVVAVDAQNNVYLTNEFHYGIGRDSIEGVSGGMDANETPLQAAQRELREELGITAQQWQDFGSVDPFTTVVVSPTQLFVARELAFGATDPEGTEQIECVKISQSAAIEKVMNAEITHAPTCVLLLKLSLAAQ
jgi:ADP-ribose pyrophosphatase